MIEGKSITKEDVLQRDAAPPTTEQPFASWGDFDLPDELHYFGHPERMRARPPSLFRCGTVR